MKCFVDASVFVAILATEDDGAAWLEMLNAEPHVVTSGLAMWEAARAIARLTGQHVTTAASDLKILIERLGIDIAPIAVDEFTVASIAHDRFGKGNHSAKLNMGDCFAYACARTNGAQLLYKGDDFAKTGIA